MDIDMEKKDNRLFADLSYKDMSWSEKVRMLYFAITLIALATTEGSLLYEAILFVNMIIAFILVMKIKPSDHEKEKN